MFLNTVRKRHLIQSSIAKTSLVRVQSMNQGVWFERLKFEGAYSCDMAIGHEINAPTLEDRVGPPLNGCDDELGFADRFWVDSR